MLLLHNAIAEPPQSGSLELVGEWGMRGDGPGELAEPVAIAADVNGRVYVADRRSQLLQKFTSSGVPLFSYSDPSMRTTSALAVDAGGAIYVADAVAGRIWIHWPEGALLRSFRIAAQRAHGPFNFCVTADGTIVVPDEIGGRIQAFSPTGQLKATWKIPAASGNRPPAPIVVSSNGFDDLIYVADATSGRIYKYTYRGEQESLWDAPADSPGSLRAIGVSRDRLFALRGTNTNAQIELWNLDGKRILTDTLGGLLATLSTQTNLLLAVAPENQLFILDAAKPRVLRFQLRK